MDIVIIGNGFDLRHEIPTGFRDFLQDYSINGNRPNVIFDYFEMITKSNGWLDFEQELQSFLIYLSRFTNSITYSPMNYSFVISREKFINSPSTKAFYSSIENQMYPYFKINKFAGTLEINDDSWKSNLISEVRNDISNIIKHLNSYLNKINKNYNKMFNKIEDYSIDLIRKADTIITFNYTNFLENYALREDIHYAHGRIDDNIVLGIPYSNEITIDEFSYLFKTTQSINFDLNYKIPYKLNEDINLYFIGFSFGKSDHYFFLEVLDLINNPGSYVNINFHFLYHSYGAKNQYISNLREFIGEENLVRYHKSNRVKFYKY
jgi:hypothetical protein